jgi:hypothetical protein
VKPRYTDAHRWPRGYATAAQTGEAGYLKAKFEKLRIEQEQARAETQQKVAAINRNKGKTCSER